jgi:putative thiamine transport system permease protein
VNSLSKMLGLIPLSLLFAVPLLASLLFAFRGVVDVAGWQALFSHPQLWPSLEISIFTGLTSALLSLIAAIIIVAGLYHSRKISVITGAMLAVPHVAMAIGISVLIMPSGFVARLISMFTGWDSPPKWITTHDPYGFAMISVLVIKETPFLVWNLLSILHREDLQQSFSGQRAAALSLGHGMGSIWIRIFLPQILPKLIWPMVIVFVYAATVVDVALVIGPTQPPPLSLIVWADINDAQVVNAARGAAGAWFLTGMVAAACLSIWGVAKAVMAQRSWLTVGPLGRDLTRPLRTAPLARVRSLVLVSQAKFCSLALLYLITMLVLILLSFAPLWPFPHLWPETLSFSAWARLLQNPSAFFTSIILAITTTFTALALIVAWMESQPPSHDQFIVWLSALSLGLPVILLSLGQYQAFLQVGLTGTSIGLFTAHLIPVTAYMFIVLVGPYRSFDPRWQASASGLMVGFWSFLRTVKLPLLKAPLSGACAIGFAVSFSQYVPAQLISAGRFSTLPMEAVTLTSGTNRPLIAAFAFLLMLPPLLVFMLSGFFSRSRWGKI